MKIKSDIALVSCYSITKKKKKKNFFPRKITSAILGKDKFETNITFHKASVIGHTGIEFF